MSDNVNGHASKSLRSKPKSQIWHSSSFDKLGHETPITRNVFFYWIILLTYSFRRFWTWEAPSVGNCGRDLKRPQTSIGAKPSALSFWKRPFRTGCWETPEGKTKQIYQTGKSTRNSTKINRWFIHQLDSLVLGDPKDEGVRQHSCLSSWIQIYKNIKKKKRYPIYFTNFSYAIKHQWTFSSRSRGFNFSVAADLSQSWISYQNVEL